MTIVEKILNSSLIVPVQLLKPYVGFKYKYAVRTYHTDKEKRRLAQGLFNFCDRLFNDKEIMELIEAFGQVKEKYRGGDLVWRQEWPAIVSLLTRMERLSDFYDLNMDTGRAIKDRRYHLFTGLRGDACYIINFLQLRTKKRERKPYKSPGGFRNFNLN